MGESSTDCEVASPRNAVWGKKNSKVNEARYLQIEETCCFFSAGNANCRLLGHTIGHQAQQNMMIENDMCLQESDTDEWNVAQ
jgi:hypothetical protein